FASHHSLVLFLLPPFATNSGSKAAASTASRLLLYSPSTKINLRMISSAGTSGFWDDSRGCTRGYPVLLNSAHASHPSGYKASHFWVMICSNCLSLEPPVSKATGISEVAGVFH